MTLKNNRLAAFLCLLALAALIPAYFLPALLVTNSIDGSRWFSIWSGIVWFFEEGNYALGAIIFLFSVVFPIAKLAITILSCLGPRFLSEKAAEKLIAVAGWTGKYSMLDVLVIAMLIVLVKVDEYVKLLPTVGLYLFAFAIFASIAANMAYVPPKKLVPEGPKNGRARWMPLAVLGVGVLVFLTGFGFLRKDAGGLVDAVRLKPLNERILPRTVERIKSIKDVHDEGEGWLSRDMWESIKNTIQALSSDTGILTPEFRVAVELADGRTVETEPFEIDMEPEINQGEWTPELPEELPLEVIEKISLLSRVNYVSSLGTTVEEESLSVDDDPFRRHVRTWHGRIFSMELLGPPRPLQTSGWTFLILGGLASMAGLSMILFRHRPGSQAGGK